MDPTMPAPGVESAFETVRRRCPESRVVVPTMHEDASLVAKALLTKFLSMTEVVALVRSAATATWHE